MAAEDVIARVRSFIEATGMSLASAARGAGLHQNSLGRLYDPTWSARLSTLTRLERWLDAAEDEQPITELPLSGEGWEVVHDKDGFWLLSAGQPARGPYNRVRAAVTDAFLPEKKRVRIGAKESEPVA